jgi:hypothetical protein
MLLSVGDWKLRVQALSKIWDKRIFERKISSCQEDIIHQLVYISGPKSTYQNATLLIDPQIIQILNDRPVKFFQYYEKCQYITNL